MWSTVKWPQMKGLKLLLVRPYDLDTLRRRAGGDGAPAPTHEAVVCADLLDAGVGDDVIIAYGHAARVAAWEALAGGGAPPSPATAPPVPIDAAVVAVVDSLNLPEV